MEPLNNSLSILIVDDEDDARETLVRVIKIKYPDMTIYSAENGRSGIECFKAHSPEIIITDISMPVMDGIKMASEIKLLSSEAIIIAVTAYTDASYLLGAIGIGITHYVLKPLVFEKIFAFIDKSVAAIKQERQIRAQNDHIRKLSKAVEQAQSSLVITDIDGKIEYINPMFTKLTGYNADEAIGKILCTLQTGATSEEECAGLWNSVKAGNEWKGELHNRKKNGDLYWESSSISPVYDEAAVITHFIAISEDITDRKEMEDALQKMQAERIRTSQLAALGELAAGVAHEINNPMQSIINYAEYIHHESNAESREMECASRIIREGERIATIVQTLLEFARNRNDEKVSTDINDIIRDSLVLTNAQLRKDHIRLFLNLIEGSIPAVYADPQQILQVVLNLISNARYALNKKYPASDRNKCITVSSTVITSNGKPMVEVAFLDNGTGIAKQTLHRVLEPFYTTKANHEGTGLGLSISHSIISSHGGTLKIESTEGEYARVAFTLPVWRDR